MACAPCEQRKAALAAKMKQANQPKPAPTPVTTNKGGVQKSSTFRFG